MYASLHRSSQLGLLARDFASIRVRKAGSRRDKTVRRIVSRLGLMHGLPQKIGQLLAFSEIDASDQSFTRLTESPSKQATKAELLNVEKALGDSISNLFSHFEPEGISASIGKVYRGVLKDGRSVAVKVQHPGVADAVNYDLRALGWLTVPLGGLRKNFDLASYRREIGESLSSELDYRLEAANIRAFSRLARGLSGKVQVPEVIEEFSSGDALTMSWLSGDHLSQAATWSQSDRLLLSKTLVEFFLSSCLDWGIIHADPHPGNYRFSRIEGKPTIGLLDFGCVKRLPARLQSGLRGLIEMGMNGEIDSDSVFAQFEKMGFNTAALEPMKTKLASVASVLLEPFAKSGPYNVARWELSARLKEILSSDRMNFRAAGPSELIFFLRSFQGLIQYLKILDTPVDWRMFAERVLQKQPLEDVSREAPPEDRTTVKHMNSETLHIEVMENGERKVALAFGASATDNLSDLVPHELHQRLADRSINLKEISRKAKASNYQPGELFSLKEESKSVSVWLQ